MPAKGHKTAHTSVEYVVEVFDWAGAWPIPSYGPTKSSQEISLFGDFMALEALSNATPSGKSGGAADLAGILSSVAKTVSPDKKKISKKVFSGVKTIEYNRSKSRIDGTCAISAVGPLPKSVRVGNWIIVSSIYSREGIGNDFSLFGLLQKSGSENGFTVLCRFIGQIFQIDTAYTNDGSGNVVTTHTILAKEWSSALNTPIIFDLMAIAKQTLDGSPTGGVAALIGTLQNNLLGGAGNVPTTLDSGISQSLKKAGLGQQSEQFVTISDLLSKQFNPYYVARLILWMIANINVQSTDVGSNPIWATASLMPDIPESLMKRIGITGVKQETAFRDGFVKVIAGRQIGGYNSDGTWNGIFEKNGIDEFSEKHNDFRDDESKQPSASGLIAVAQLGNVSAWELMTAQVDPALNDLYTDILYEYDSDGNIRAQPTIFVRGKPFRTTAAESRFGMKDLMVAPGLKDFLDSWTLYDELPRVRVNEEYIVGLSISNSCQNVANYIRPVHVGPYQTVDNAKSKAVATGYAIRIEGSMRRFGGFEFPVQSKYFSTTDPVTWTYGITYLGVSWYADSYRTASGTLQLKDCVLPISVGMNIQFTVGKYELVAHVEGISGYFGVDEDGGRYSGQTITFSRLMCVHPVTKKLTFLPPGAFTDIFDILEDKSIGGEFGVLTDLKSIYKKLV